MIVRGQGDFKFCSNAISRRDQYRVTISRGRHIEEPAKAANIHIGARSFGRADVRANCLNQIGGCVYIDAGIFVGLALNRFLVH